MPGSGPPDPDLHPRVAALWEAVHEGASDETIRVEFGVTMSEPTRRALAMAPAPLHAQVMVGDVAHCLYSMGGVLVVAVRAVDAEKAAAE